MVKYIFLMISQDTYGRFLNDHYNILL